MASAFRWGPSLNKLSSFPLLKAWRSRRAFFVVALGCSGFGCDSSAEREQHKRARAELFALGEAIDAIREAPNAEKKPLLTPLEHAPCTQFCELRDTCRDAYRIHLEGVELMTQAKHEKDHTQATTLLSDSATKLKEALPQTTKCAELQSQLKRSNAL